MSPRKSVDKLSVLCRKYLSEFTVEVIKYLHFESLRVFRKIYYALPNKLKQEILEEILESNPLNSTVKRIAFEIFWGSCRKFDCRHFPRRYHELFARGLRNVTYLNLTHARIIDTTVARIIKNSQHLRALLIPELCTDFILAQICNLPNLKLLDISGHVPITEEGYQKFHNSSLEILNVGTSLCPEIGPCEGCDLIPLILSQFPRLTEIGVYEFTGQSLLGLKEAYVSKLKVLSDYGTGFQQMIAIIGVCPDLQELYLQEAENDALNLLPEIKDLKKLKLLKYELGTLDVRLDALTVEEIILVGYKVNINALSKTLQVLSLKKCQIHVECLSNICYRNITVLEFTDCDVTKVLVKAFVEICDRLQRLAVTNEIELNDEDIKNWIKRKKLRNIQELWLSKAHSLTVDSVVHLINYCHELVSIGTLNGWCIDRTEVNYLRCIMHFRNLECTLLYFSCF